MDPPQKGIVSYQSAYTHWNLLHLCTWIEKLDWEAYSLWYWFNISKAPFVRLAEIWYVSNYYFSISLEFKGVWEIEHGRIVFMDIFHLLSILPYPWTSPVVQQLRICLAIQGTWVQPWSGKIPHAAGQLSICTTTPEPVFCNKRSLLNEKPAHSNKDPMQPR